MNKLAVSMGICAYNEEGNLDNLLDRLISYRPKNFIMKEIIVVSDGSTDGTNSIIKKAAKRSIKIKSIISKERKGKICAINLILKKASGDIIILESGDTIPDDGSLDLLIEPFKDESIGITASCIVPTIPDKGFMSFVGRFMYRMHHKMSCINPKFGEMIAFRNIIDKIPQTSVDEEVIAMLIHSNGYSGYYAKDAVVYNQSAGTVSDFIRQRRRIYCGHIALEKENNFRISTFKNSKVFTEILKDWRFVLPNIPYVMGAIGLEVFGRLLGMVDYHIYSDKKHYLWAIAESTKTGVSDKKAAKAKKKII